MEVKTSDMDTTLNKLYDLLSNHSKVYYIRYGDGDFNIMSGSGKCRHHTASPELKKELIESFMIDDPYYIKSVMVYGSMFNGTSLKPSVPGRDKQRVSFISTLYRGGRSEISYDSVVLFTYMAVCDQEKMSKFLDTFIRPKKKLFIGSVDKIKIEKLIGNIDYYIEVPDFNAYYTIDDWWPKVLEVVDDVELVLPSAGMAGRVVCGRLWNLNKDVHCIELGSMVDPAVGLKTRSIWNDKTIAKVQNLLKEI